MNNHLFRSTYCANCGAKYDPALGTCPKCSQRGAYFEESRRLEKLTPLGWGKELAMFLVGWAGFQIIVYVIAQFVAGAYLRSNPNSTDAQINAYLSTPPALSLIYFVGYALLFVIMLSIVNVDLPRLGKKFAEGRSYYGILFGFGIIAFSIALNIFIDAVSPGSGTNANQSNVEKIVTESPFLSVLLLGIVGPICEEFTYRVGLFGFLKRASTYLAYFLAVLIFAAIHFDFMTDDWATELLNLPFYIFAGLAFAWVYDKFGFGASVLAHVTNNVFSVLMTILQGQAK